MREVIVWKIIDLFFSHEITFLDCTTFSNLFCTDLKVRHMSVTLNENRESMRRLRSYHHSNQNAIDWLTRYWGTSPELSASCCHSFDDIAICGKNPYRQAPEVACKDLRKTAISRLSSWELSRFAVRGLRHTTTGCKEIKRVILRHARRNFIKKISRTKGSLIHVPS